MPAVGVFLPASLKFLGTGPGLVNKFVRLSVVVAVEDVDAEFAVVVLTVLTLGLDGPVDSELSHESSLPSEDEALVTTVSVCLLDSEPLMFCLAPDFSDSLVPPVEPEKLLLRRSGAPCVVLVDIQIYPYRD
jgi:hypothetical protein